MICIYLNIYIYLYYFHGSYRTLLAFPVSLRGCFAQEVLRSLGGADAAGPRPGTEIPEKMEVFIGKTLLKWRFRAGETGKLRVS